MSLLSASEIAAVREVAESGMVTDVLIYHGVRGQTANGQSFTFPTTPDVRTKGWLTERTSSSTKLDTIEGVVSLSEIQRLLLPIGTDCRFGDKVVIDGLEFIAQHNNAGDTYTPYTEVFLRRQV